MTDPRHSGTECPSCGAKTCPWCGKPWDDEHVETTAFGVPVIGCPDYLEHMPLSGFLANALASR